MRTLLIGLVLGLFIAAPAMSQEEESFLSRFAFGTGSAFGEETQTFDRDSVFAAAHVDGYDIPFADGGSTGVGIEAGFPTIGGVSYQLFSINRANVPGVSGLYGGMDFKFGQGNDLSSYDWDYDARIVVGYNLGTIGPGTLNLEVYSLEDGRPIAWAFIFDL